MALYAIGDVQGCLSALQHLLDKIQFNPSQDHLWFAGDLVNRGPSSLATLRFIKGLGDRATCVLGNHDLHLLAVAYNAHKPKRGDTFTEILQAKDRIELIEWLRHLPLFHVKQSLCIVHAGLIPEWSIADACLHAQEVEAFLHSDQVDQFLSNMYGKEPNRWNANLSGWDRLRFITNVMTRIRYMKADLQLEMKAKLAPEDEEPGFIPWFDMPNRQSSEATIVFGHWSTLGLRVQKNLISLDTGCVWGRQITAIRLDKDRQVFQVNCEDCV